MIYPKCVVIPSLGKTFYKIGEMSDQSFYLLNDEHDKICVYALGIVTFGHNVNISIKQEINSEEFILTTTESNVIVIR